MPRPPVMPAEDKLRIVLALLSGEVSVAAAARRHGVSEQTVGNWKRQFLAGGLVALGGSSSGTAATREAALRAEVEHLRSALAEAQVQLRVWKRSAERRLPPFDDLEVIRQDAAMPVSRFCTLTGIPRRTYTRWLTNGPRAGQRRMEPSVDTDLG
jgi:transposase